VECFVPRLLGRACSGRLGPGCGRATGDAAGLRRPRDRESDCRDHCTVEHAGDDLLGVQLVVADHCSNSGLMVFGIGGGGCCATAANIRERGTWSSSGSPNQLLFVVPDGVSRLRVTLRTGPNPRNPPTVDGKMQDNVIVLRTPFVVETLSGDSTTWYGATGRIVKRFRE
jgi:hypothetical protein